MSAMDIDTDSKSKDKKPRFEVKKVASRLFSGNGINSTLIACSGTPSRSGPGVRYIYH